MRRSLITLSFFIWMLPTSVALAHVKWFCAFDVAERPRPLGNVLDPDLFYLIAIAVVIFFVAGLVNKTILGRGLVWSIDRATLPLQAQSPLLMRATYGAFFIALWSIGGVILTPELTTPVASISWLQLAIAVCFLWRRTLILASAGMVFLYGYAIWKYGLFHLMDYPIFLGAAAYFAMVGLDWRPVGITPLDVVRMAASVTLMWASVEKWGYPQWTYPLFVTHPEMSMGFNVAFYMTAAGVVEFSLAFALGGPPLMRRTSAIVLASMFIAAIAEFGKIDAIGHAPIIVVLLAIAADGRPARPRSAFLAPTVYVGALVLVIAAYYIGHLLLFHRSI